MKIFCSIISLVIIGTTLFCMNENSYAATYYLSPTGSDTYGSGTKGSPWFSPDKARRSAGTVKPGDIIIFMDGTYKYDKSACLLGYSGNDGGTDSEIITYRAENNGNVIIDFNGDYGWRLEENYGSANITIDGLTLINTNLGVRLSDENQIARNIRVTATRTWPPSGNACSSAQGSGGFETGERAVNFLIENCIADQCAVNETSHGIYCAGGTGIIRDSIFRNNLGNGIQIQAANDTHDIGEVYVYRNRVYNNTERHGIYCSSYGGGTINTIKIFNNFVWNNGKNYSSGYGITVNNAGHAEVQNNTLYDNRAGINIANTKSGYMRDNISIGNSSSDISSNTSANDYLIKESNLVTSVNQNQADEYGVSGAFVASNFHQQMPEIQTF